MIRHKIILAASPNQCVSELLIAIDCYEREASTKNQLSRVQQMVAWLREKQMIKQRYILVV